MARNGFKGHLDDLGIECHMPNECTVPKQILKHETRNAKKTKYNLKYDIRKTKKHVNSRNTKTK